MCLDTQSPTLKHLQATQSISAGKVLHTFEALLWSTAALALPGGTSCWRCHFSLGCHEFRLTRAIFKSYYKLSSFDLTLTLFPLDHSHEDDMGSTRARARGRLTSGFWKGRAAE